MPVDVLLGLQWGDEGKGKIVDVLTPNYDIVARFQGGPNAGHTLEFSGEKHILHLIPSGIFHPGSMNIIGNGVIIDPFILKKELDKLEKIDPETLNRLMISRKAHLILPTHRLLDSVYEQAKGKAKIGSTLKGIGPAYSDKTGRNGIRIGDIFNPGFREQYENLKKRHLNIIEFHGVNIDDFRLEKEFTLNEYEELWFEAIEKLKTITLINSEYFLNNAIKEGKNILAEGAQGTLLDIDFGSYPFVTSSNTITSGVCSGLGIPPSAINRVFGIVKAYCTRVGSGPFPTELFDEDGQSLRDMGKEYGSTTGRPRRCGWLDIPALKYALMLNGVTHMFITKVDVLNEFSKIRICDEYMIKGKKTQQLPFDIKNCEIEPVLKEFDGWQQDLDDVKAFDKLPSKLSVYLKYIEEETDTPISIISTGADRKAIIIQDNFLNL